MRAPRAELVEPAAAPGARVLVSMRNLPKLSVRRSAHAAAPGPLAPARDTRRRPPLSQSTATRSKATTASCALPWQHIAGLGQCLSGARAPHPPRRPTNNIACALISNLLSRKKHVHLIILVITKESDLAKQPLQREIIQYQ